MGCQRKKYFTYLIILEIIILNPLKTKIRYAGLFGLTDLGPKGFLQSDYKNSDLRLKYSYVRVNI
jgi:hypothetical protein